MSIHIEYAEAKSANPQYGFESDIFEREFDPLFDQADKVLVLGGDSAFVLTGTREELIEMATRILSVLNWAGSTEEAST